MTFGSDNFRRLRNSMQTTISDLTKIPFVNNARVSLLRAEMLCGLKKKIFKWASEVPLDARCFFFFVAKGNKTAQFEKEMFAASETWSEMDADKIH